MHAPATLNTGITFAVTKNRLASDFNAATQIIGLVTRSRG